MKPTNLVMGHAAFYPHTPVPVGIAKPLPKLRVVKKVKKQTKPFDARFLEKVNMNGTGGCWIWLASKNNMGYGQFHFGGKPVKAHRISWFIFKGQVPDGMNVLHKCDNPLCVNPDHLFLGTQMDNVVDMTAKGRNKFIAHKGEENGAHKISDKSVLLIRERYKSLKSYSKTAAEFGISKSQVHNIIMNKQRKQQPNTTLS